MFVAAIARSQANRFFQHIAGDDAKQPAPAGAAGAAGAAGPAGAVAGAGGAPAVEQKEEKRHGDGDGDVAGLDDAEPQTDVADEKAAAEAKEAKAAASAAAAVEPESERKRVERMLGIDASNEEAVHVNEAELKRRLGEPDPSLFPLVRAQHCCSIV